MQIRTDNRIRIHGLSPLKAEELKDEYTYDNPDFKKAVSRQRAQPYNRGKDPEDIKPPKGIPRKLKTWEEEDGWLSVPRGPQVKLHNAMGLEFEPGEFLGDPSLKGNLKYKGKPLYPHQRDLIRAGLNHSTCLWRSPPGSGKTTAALAYAAELNLPTLVVVPTKEIFNQWVNRAQSDLGLKKSEIGIIGNGKQTLGKLTIGMQQTLVNRIDSVADKFGCVICDEAQRFGAKTFFTVVDRLKAKYRLGVTASEKRADGKEFLIYDVFGEPQWEVDRQMLIEGGFIIDAEICIVPTEFTAPWYMKLKPQRRQLAANKLLHQILGDDPRNQLIGEILHECGDEQTIILTKRREHCHVLDTLALESGIHSGLFIGSADYAAQFKESREAMEDGSLRVAIGTYQAVGVGFDIPAITRGIFAAPVANSRDGREQFEQYCGRFERPSEGKDTSIIYYLWDRHVHGDGPLHNLRRWKKDKAVVMVGDRKVPVSEYLKGLESGKKTVKKKRTKSGRQPFFD